MAVTWRWRTFVKDAPLELDFTYVLSRDYDKSGVSCRIGVNGLQHRRFMVGAKGKYSFTIDKPELGSLHGAEVVIKVKNKLLGSSLKAEEAHVNGHDLGKPYKVQPGEHSVFRTDWEFPYGHMRYRLTIKVIKHAAKIYLNGLPIPLAREIKVSDTFALSYEMRPTNLGMGDIGAIDRIVVTLHHLRKENYEAEAELLDSRGSTLFTRQSLAFVTEPKEEPFVWQCMAGNSESDLQDVLTMTRDAIHANGEGSQPGSVASREWVRSASNGQASSGPSEPGTPGTAGTASTASTPAPLRQLSAEADPAKQRSPFGSSAGGPSTPDPAEPHLQARLDQQQRVAGDRPASSSTPVVPGLLSVPVRRASLAAEAAARRADALAAARLAAQQEVPRSLNEAIAVFTGSDSGSGSAAGSSAPIPAAIPERLDLPEIPEVPEPPTTSASASSCSSPPLLAAYVEPRQQHPAVSAREADQELPAQRRRRAAHIEPLQQQPAVHAGGADQEWRAHERCRSLDSRKPERAGPSDASRARPGVLHTHSSSSPPATSRASSIANSPAPRGPTTPFAAHPAFAPLSPAPAVPALHAEQHLPMIRADSPLLATMKEPPSPLTPNSTMFAESSGRDLASPAPPLPPASAGVAESPPVSYPLDSPQSSITPILPHTWPAQPPTPEPTTEASRPAAHSVAVDTADLQPTQQTPSSSADQTTPSPEQARQREALQAAEGRVAALEVRLRELHTRSRQLQGENQALRRANRELADDKQATDVGSVQLQIRHRELQAQAQDLRNTVQRLRDGQQAAQAGQTEELEEALQDTQDLLAASKDRVRQLTQELRDGQARVASRDARIAELLEETGRLNTEVNRSRAAHAALLRELTSSSGGAASDTAKALAAAQHRTEVAVQEASQAQASAATANEALHTARLALHGVLAGVRDELSDVRAALKAAQEESAEKGRELTTLQQSLKQGYMIDQSAHEAALEAVEQRWKQSLAAFFSCPISGEVFRDPVLAADGHTYERVDIRRWLRRKNTSPQTRQPLPIKVLVPNHMVRSAVQELIHGGMLEAPPERSASDGLNAG